MFIKTTGPLFAAAFSFVALSAAAETGKSTDIYLAQSANAPSSDCGGQDQSTRILRSEGVIEKLAEAFEKQKNPLTNIPCALSCLPLPAELQDQRSNTVELYTWGMLGASITNGHVIATLHDGRAFKYLIRPTYAAAPYASTPLGVPYLDLATIRDFSISLIGTIDGFQEPVEWGRTYAVKLNGDRFGLQAMSPVNAAPVRKATACS